MRKRLLAGQLIIVGILVLVLVPGASAGPEACDDRVNDTWQKLLECVTVEGVREHQAALQDIADANNGVRTSGTPGYDASVEYVVERMTAAGYNVTLQEFQFFSFNDLGGSVLEQTAPGSVGYVEGVDFFVMDQSDPGDVTAAVTPVDLQLGLNNTSTSGCEAADFAGFPAGNIALIQRGTCTFRLKAENAAAAGAVGAIIFNQGNTPGRTGLFLGTLSTFYSGGIPVFATSYTLGEQLAGIAGLEMHLLANVTRVPSVTQNVFAESRSGDSKKVVMAGAHLDSVSEGPGIQDNGSGSAALLEIAEQMAKVKPRYKVRFAWWGAEESGLVGSTFYVNSLTSAQLSRIKLYLNFDMVGSPNHVFFIYDGDNSDNVGAGPGPTGSAHIEKAFETYFNNVSLPFKGTDFDGRSDYGPFIAAGIPSGGLFTGAEGIKTAQEAAQWGGTAGVAYDSCYHQACDTYANINLSALDTNSDAIAFAVLQFAMNLQGITGERGKGNFNPDHWGNLIIK